MDRNATSAPGNRAERNQKVPPEPTPPASKFPPPDPGIPKPPGVVASPLVSVGQQFAELSTMIANGDLADGKDKPDGERKHYHHHRRRRRAPVLEEQPKEPPPPPPESKGGRTIWRNIAWLIILFAYSGIGGVTFSAIEGGHDRTEKLRAYERAVDVYEKRKDYQSQLFQKILDIQNDNEVKEGDVDDNETTDRTLDQVVKAIEWYEKRVGFEVKPPVMEDTDWDIWGGVYYSASLYTTIGYGNLCPNTRAGRIISMIYAFCGIPLVFTIYLEWGFLYFTWIEVFWRWVNQKLCFNSHEAHLRRKIKQERFRRAGSEMSLSLRNTPSASPLMKIGGVKKKEDMHGTDHQIESGKRLAQLEIELSEAEQQRTVPLKAALIFFFLWILIAAFIVRFWETNWTYFTAYYYFFTSLTTIGLGDVVTETQNYIIFNLALTMVGMSVVGLCVAIVQAKIRLIFDRMIRSIDAQYRVRQIDPDVATMSLIPNEKEGIKRLCEAQPIQDRIIFVAMDEHKKQLLEDRWKQKSSMVNRITQTWPSRADKCIQTGQRVDDQPLMRYEGPYEEEEEDSYSDSNESDAAEYDATGKRIVPPSTRRYIYTVFD